MLPSPGPILFGDEDPIGRKFPRPRNDSVIFTVIGVVEPTREEPLGSFLAFEEGAVSTHLLPLPYEDSDNFYQVPWGGSDVDLFAQER